MVSTIVRKLVITGPVLLVIKKCMKSVDVVALVSKSSVTRPMLLIEKNTTATKNVNKCFHAKNTSVISTVALLASNREAIYVSKCAIKNYRVKSMSVDFFVISEAAHPVL